MIFSEQNLHLFAEDGAEKSRAAGAVGTLGATEIANLPVSGPEFLIRKHEDNKAVREKINRIAMLMNDLIAEEEEQKKEAVLGGTKNEIDKVKYREEVSKIKNQIKTEFSDRIDMEQKGDKVKIPNAIMLVDEHDDLSKELVAWTGKNSDCNFIQIEDADNKTLQNSLWKTLNDSKETFTKTKHRTLVSVEGFDRLITAGKNEFECIESLKDILSRSASDFGSTIIFRTKDASKLVEEAIQPQRVGAKIMVTIKSFK